MTNCVVTLLVLSLATSGFSAAVPSRLSLPFGYSLPTLPATIDLKSIGNLLQLPNGITLDALTSALNLDNIQASSLPQSLGNVANPLQSITPSGASSLIPNPFADAQRDAQLAFRLLGLIRKSLNGEAKMDEFLDIALQLQGGKNAPTMDELRSLFQDLTSVKNTSDAATVLTSAQNQATVRKLGFMVARSALLT